MSELYAVFGFAPVIAIDDARDAVALAGVLPDESADGGPAREALKQGLLRRLSETAAKARLFQAMAA